MPAQDKQPASARLCCCAKRHHKPGKVTSWMHLATAMCIAVGNESLELWQYRASTLWITAARAAPWATNHALVHVVVGVDGLLGALFPTENLNGPVGQHLIDVHVGLSA